MGTPALEQIAKKHGILLIVQYEYDEIDPQRVYEGLQAAVKEIPEYLRHIHRYLQQFPPL